MNPTEKQIEDATWQLLTAHGYFCFKHKDQSHRVNNSYKKNPIEINGVADLCVFAGRVVYIELKTPKGVQSQAQIDFQAQCDLNSIPYLVTTSPKAALEFVTAIDSGRSNLAPKLV
jgi:hypothetical protein